MTTPEVATAAIKHTLGFDDPLVKILLSIIAALGGYAVIMMRYYFQRFDKKLDSYDRRFQLWESRFDNIEGRVTRIETVCQMRRSTDWKGNDSDPGSC